MIIMTFQAPSVAVGIPTVDSCILVPVTKDGLLLFRFLAGFGFQISFYPEIRYLDMEIWLSSSDSHGWVIVVQFTLQRGNSALPRRLVILDSQQQALSF